MLSASKLLSFPLLFPIPYSLFPIPYSQQLTLIVSTDLIVKLITTQSNLKSILIYVYQMYPGY